eukprot:g7022.t1
MGGASPGAAADSRSSALTLALTLACYGALVAQQWEQLASICALVSPVYGAAAFCVASLCVSIHACIEKAEEVRLTTAIAGPSSSDIQRIATQLSPAVERKTGTSASAALSKTCGFWADVLLLYPTYGVAVAATSSAEYDSLACVFVYAGTAFGLLWQQFPRKMGLQNLASFSCPAFSILPANVLNFLGRSHGAKTTAQNVDEVEKLYPEQLSARLKADERLRSLFDCVYERREPWREAVSLPPGSSRSMESATSRNSASGLKDPAHDHEELKALLQAVPAAVNIRGPKIFGFTFYNIVYPLLLIQRKDPVWLIYAVVAANLVDRIWMWTQLTPFEQRSFRRQRWMHDVTVGLCWIYTLLICGRAVVHEGVSGFATGAFIIWRAFYLGHLLLFIGEHVIPSMCFGLQPFSVLVPQKTTSAQKQVLQLLQSGFSRRSQSSADRGTEGLMDRAQEIYLKKNWREEIYSSSAQLTTLAFHGTGASTCISILKHGFRPKLGQIGTVTYFASDLDAASCFSGDGWVFLVLLNPNTYVTGVTTANFTPQSEGRECPIYVAYREQDVRILGIMRVRLYDGPWAPAMRDRGLLQEEFRKFVEAASSCAAEHQDENNEKDALTSTASTISGSTDQTAASRSSFGASTSTSSVSLSSDTTTPTFQTTGAAPPESLSTAATATGAHRNANGHQMESSSKRSSYVSTAAELRARRGGDVESEKAKVQHRFALWNIQFWHTLSGRLDIDAFFGVIRELDADTLVLNEVMFLWPYLTKRQFEKRMSAEGGYTGFVYGNTTKWDLSMRLRGAFFGNVLASRGAKAAAGGGGGRDSSLKRTKVLNMPGAGEYRPHEHRSAVCGCVDIADESTGEIVEGVQVIGTHLEIWDLAGKVAQDQAKFILAEADKDKLDAERRTGGAVREVRSSDSPGGTRPGRPAGPPSSWQIICGDFNSFRSCEYSDARLDRFPKPHHLEVPELLEKHGFADSFDVCGVPPPEMTVWSTMARPDGSEDLRSEEWRSYVYKNATSDHMPLVLDRVRFVKK